MSKIRVIGMKELQKALNTKEAQVEVKRIVRKHGSQMQIKMQDNADFRGHYKGNKFVSPTGDTKQSIGLEIKDDGFTAEVGAKTEYAPYLEYGTRFMDAQPFVKPAYEEQKEKFKSDMKNLAK